MARTRYVPEAEKREPRYGKGDEDFRHAGNDELPSDDSEAWEFESIANFCEHLADEERTTFTTPELVALATRTGTYNTTLRMVLESKGLTLVGIVRERSFATFGTNQHDRWINSGTHGGGGGDSITGFAGRAG